MTPPEPGDVLELDELWSFVQCKANAWVAPCRRTRQVVPWFAGGRSADSCRKPWEPSPKPTGLPTPTAISGKPTRVFLGKTTNQWAKKQGKPRMWNAGTTLCGNV